MQYKFKNIAAAMIVGVTIAAGVGAQPVKTQAVSAADAFSESTVPTVKAESPVPVTPLKVREASALDLWLEKLAHKESNGQDNIRILDTNGRYSYGCLQFQEWTFRTYGRKYGILSNDSTWETSIYNCGLQKQIAKRMIMDDYKLWQSWYTSVTSRDLGLPPRS